MCQDFVDLVQVLELLGDSRESQQPLFIPSLQQELCHLDLHQVAALVSAGGLEEPTHRYVFVHQILNIIGVLTVYVLIQAHAPLDAQAPPAKYIPHQIHTNCLIKHQKIVKKTH